MGGKRSSLELDRALAALAARQHGVVSASQLLALGMSRRRIEVRVAAARLHPVHRGVYAAGHPLISARGHWLAAVLAVGGGAALSHRSAAALLDLLPSSARRVDVTVARRVRAREAIRVHCVRELPGAELTVVEAIPCTSPARTLADLAGVVAPRQLERALGQAEVLRLYDRAAIEAAGARRRTLRGSGTLRRLLERDDAATTLTRSALEERLLRLCDRAGLARPELNVPLTLPDGSEAVVDALWRDARLVVEVDGRRYHATRAALESDRRRDAQLTLAGLRPVRLTASDLAGRAPQTVALLRALLAGGPRR